MVLVSEKASKNTKLAANSAVPGAEANQTVQSMKAREAPKVIHSLKETPRSVFASCTAAVPSVSQVNDAHETISVSWRALASAGQ